MATKGNETEVSLHQELEERYLAYALSTIVSRALPDVRDGLKPVQRRIIYGMETLGPKAAARFVKSARVVGEVIGKYHPHGDQAVYQAMARMAQDFSLRYPLVDGQGNFGSLDGDAPAAMRYTEARLSPLAKEFLADLDAKAVTLRPNYDGSLTEPAVLPARVPGLLINGSSGIAVGISTSIPPHNLAEVIDGLVHLIDSPEAKTRELMRHIKGPDFPTRGLITTSKKELTELYRSGKGSVHLRGEWEVEAAGRGRRNFVVTSIPYTVNKARLVESIFRLIQERKLPMVSEVRDESTEDVRVVLELKDDSVDPEEVAAFLYKKTDLATNVSVNLTCLTPEGVPERLSLVEILNYFLDFRKDVTTARLEKEREELLARLHLLEGLIVIFSDLDRAIGIIRRAASRAEAREKLVEEFGLDETQADAILNMRLAALVRMEREGVNLELREKTDRVRDIEDILASEDKVWAQVKRDLTLVKNTYRDARRTKMVRAREEPTYSPESFLAKDEVVLTLSERGWVRMAKSFDPEKVPLREGDDLLTHLETDTLSLVAFFSSFGKVYVTRAGDIDAPAKGYGMPIMTAFGFADGERVVSCLLPGEVEEEPEEEGQMELFREKREALWAAVSNRGRGFLLGPGLAGSPTSRSGRVIYRVKKDEELIGVKEVAPGCLILLATKERLLALHPENLPRRSGPSQGVALMKLRREEEVSDFLAAPEGASVLVEPEKGKPYEIEWEDMPTGSRATRGRKMKGGIRSISLIETEEEYTEE